MTDGERGRAAAGVAWHRVYDELAALDSAELDADGLERLAEAAFWVGRPREEIAARQHAYAAHRRAGHIPGAIKAAWLLFHHHFDLDEIATASGWLGRAHRHAQEVPGSVECGYVAIGDATFALYSDATEDAVAHSRRAVETGTAHEEPDLVALGVAHEGRALIARGDVAEGVGLLDEAMVAATGGELRPFVTGWIYCLLLDTCQGLGDVRRAGEWTETAKRWCQDLGEDSWYRGLCRLHRCEVATLRGEWSSAEAEALSAAEELVGFGDYLIADGQYLAGEIRRRRGDYDGAEEAFRRAHRFGRDPQPGLALLRLARGDADAAATALRVALAAGSRGALARAQVLAAHVQTELAAGNRDAARASADELAGVATETGMPLLRAMAAAATGAVRLSADAVERAFPPLREAWAAFRELSCPYEAAQVQALLGVAAHRAGDDETARLELEAAGATFRRLGATPDAERVSALLRRRVFPAGLTGREVQILRQVADGKSNRMIASELFISEHTVARHLSNIFRKIDVSSRSAATAYAFEHGLA